MDIEIISNSPDETIAIGRKIGSQLKGGEIVGLIGTLGSGKTHLIKGIVSGSGGLENEKIVNSPTFVIINEYYGKFKIYHIDAYRLNSVDEFEMLGFDDFCLPDSIVLIEWADKIAAVLDQTGYIRIYLSHEGAARRGVRIKNLPGCISMTD